MSSWMATATSRTGQRRNLGAQSRAARSRRPSLQPSLPAAAARYIDEGGVVSLYDGLPDHWEWWAVNGMSVVLMALLGEYLCMRRELQDIPLFGGQSAKERSERLS